MAAYLYDVLKVDPDASETEIRAAFRQMAVRYHPDKNMQERQDAEVRFKLIREAYETLIDPIRRAEYDRKHPRYQNRRGKESTANDYDVEVDELGMVIHDMTIHTLAKIDDAFDCEVPSFESTQPVLPRNV